MLNHMVLFIIVNVIYLGAWEKVGSIPMSSQFSVALKACQKELVNVQEERGESRTQAIEHLSHCGRAQHWKIGMGFTWSPAANVQRNLSTCV